MESGHAFIQAPSGYGKSTLAVSFLYEKELPFTWLSFDQSDNNLPQLINSLCLALEQAELHIDKTLSLLSASHIVETDYLADTFMEEFGKIKASNFLVLDDFHAISDLEVKDFLLRLINQAPPEVRLIILSRSPLPATQWKSLRGIGFLGQEALKFSLDEYKDYSQHLLGIPNNPEHYHEGWITAIRLSTEGGLNEASTNNIEQLVQNAVYQFPDPENVYFLAFIGFFDVNLCIQVLGNANLVPDLLRSPLILVKTNEDRGVYRFHHLIQELILRNADRIKKENLSKLYQKAVRYFSNQEDYQHAFEIALKFDNIQLVKSTFNTYRLYCFNNSRLQELANAFTKLQQNIPKETEYHLLTQAWIEILKGNTPGMVRMMQNMDVGSVPEYLRSEYLALEAYALYVLQQPEESLKAVSTARTYEINNRYAEGYLYIFEIGSLQSIGRGNEGYSIGIEALSTTNSVLVKSNVLLVLCYISRLEAKAQQQYDFARALFKLSEEARNLEGLVQASCFLGEYYFNRGDLKTAERHLKFAYHNRKHTIGALGISIIWLYLRTLYLIGKSVVADEILQDILDEATLSGNSFLLEFYHGMRAQVQINSNQVSEASAWFESNNVISELPLSEAYSPILSLIHFGLRAKHHGVQDIVKTLEQLLQKANNERFLGELAILQAVAASFQGNLNEAKSKLSQAIKRLPIIDFKQIYTDYSSSFPVLKRLLEQVDETYRQFMPSKVLLTNREQQIIDLYTKRLTDKEIAEKLGISVATVKRHNVNIFNKLQVGSKRKALHVWSNTS